MKQPHFSSECRHGAFSEKSGLAGEEGLIGSLPQPWLQGLPPRSPTSNWVLGIWSPLALVWSRANSSLVFSFAIKEEGEEEVMNHSGTFLLQRMFQKMQNRRKVKVESLETGLRPQSMWHSRGRWVCGIPS